MLWLVKFFGSFLCQIVFYLLSIYHSVGIEVERCKIYSTVSVKKKKSKFQWYGTELKLGTLVYPEKGKRQARGKVKRLVSTLRFYCIYLTRILMMGIFLVNVLCMFYQLALRRTPPDSMIVYWHLSDLENPKVASRLWFRLFFGPQRSYHWSSVGFP